MISRTQIHDVEGGVGNLEKRDKNEDGRVKKKEGENQEETLKKRKDKIRGGDTEEDGN